MKITDYLNGLGSTDWPSKKNRICKRKGMHVTNTAILKLDCHNLKLEATTSTIDRLLPEMNSRKERTQITKRGSKFSTFK